MPMNTAALVGMLPSQLAMPNNRNAPPAMSPRNSSKDSMRCGCSCHGVRVPSAAAARRPPAWPTTWQRQDCRVHRQRDQHAAQRHAEQRHRRHARRLQIVAVLAEEIEPGEPAAVHAFDLVGAELGAARAQVAGAEVRAPVAALAEMMFEPGHRAADVAAAGHRRHVVEAVETGLARVGRRIAGLFVQEGLDDAERERRRADAAAGNRQRGTARVGELVLAARQLEREHVLSAGNRRRH